MKHLCSNSLLQNAFIRLTILLLLLISSRAAFSQTVAYNEPHTGSVLLPAGLLNFSAKQVNDKIFLNWSSNKEENLSHYIVERSYNNKSFEQAGLLFTSEKQDSVNSYMFQDVISAGAPVIYYRLKMVDKSGTVKYSPVKTIHTEKKVDFLLVNAAQPINTKVI
jgi:hypothetical protein